MCTCAPATKPHWSDLITTAAQRFVLGVYLNICDKKYFVGQISRKNPALLLEVILNRMKQNGIV